MRLAWVAVAASLWAQPAPAQQGLQLLQAMDANSDGSITRAEAEAARVVMFDRLDADDDEYLSEIERAAANGQGAVRRGLGAADANSDGRISRAEMMNLPYRGFDRLDRNDDDVISAEEGEAVRNLMQGRS
ncbi:MAG: EF-hand domain-containing protein [Caulobacteraceae bacterium]